MFVSGRDEIIDLLTPKWSCEREHALRKNLWALERSRTAVCFRHESRDRSGRGLRSYGNELLEFDENGLMRRREASINDVPIGEAYRRIFDPRSESERRPELAFA